MTEAFVPPLPSGELVFDRRAFATMAQVGLTTSGYRVLHELLARQGKGTGVAEITQREMGRVLNMSVPSVNRGFKELRVAGLAWPVPGITGAYQLSPALTGGTFESPVMAVPAVQDDPDEVAARRRERYASQTASLGHSA